MSAMASQITNLKIVVIRTFMGTKMKPFVPFFPPFIKTGSF